MQNFIRKHNHSSYSQSSYALAPMVFAAKKIGYISSHVVPINRAKLYVSNMTFIPENTEEIIIIRN